MINAASTSLSTITTQLDHVRTGYRPATTARGDAAVASAAPAGTTGASSDDPSRSFWASTLAGNTSGGGLSGATFGGAVGIDGELTGLPVVLGGAASFSRSELDNDGYNASTATNYGALSLYGLYQAGPAYVSAITTLGYGRTSFDRNLQGLGLNLSTSVDLDGTLFGGRVEAGYRHAGGQDGSERHPLRGLPARHPMAGFRLRELRELVFGAQLRRFDHERAAPLSGSSARRTMDGRQRCGLHALLAGGLDASISAPTGMCPAPSRNCRHWPSRERPSRPCPMRWTCTWGSNRPRWERHPVRQPRCSACERLFHGRGSATLRNTMVTRAIAVYPLVGRAVPRRDLLEARARAYDG